MKNILLENIPYSPDIPGLLQRLRIRQGSDREKELHAILQEAQAVARPKALFRMAFIDSCQGDTVVIDGVPFTSRVLLTNLEGLHRVFPFVATCGVELADWAGTFQDLLKRFWVDTIMETVLYGILHDLEARVSGLFIDQALGEPESLKLASMNPGSLEDWPLSEQVPLFTLLGDVTGSIGVRLTESMLMQPTKSVSGIYFASSEGFASCQLCPRPVCPNRRFPYDPDLFDQKYARIA